MPTYQQRFGHAPPPKPKRDPAIITPKPKQRVSQHLTRSAPLARRESGIGTQPKQKAPMTALERQVFAHKRYLLSQELTRKNVAGAKPNAVGKFIGGIGQHPLGTLRDVTTIDVRRFEHPIRAIQQDRSRAAAVGRQIQTGKLSLAESAPQAGSAIFPGGGRIPGLGRLFGRTAKAVPKYETILGKPSDAPALAGAERVPGPLTRAQSEAGAHQAMRETLSAGKRAAAERRRTIRQERPERVAEAMAASQKAGGKEAGLEAAKGALSGEYSKTPFATLRKKIPNAADKDSLLGTVDKHVFSENPETNFFKQLQTKQAIQNAWNHGEPPRKFENTLLQEVFGEQAAKRISLGKKAGFVALDLINIPRSFESTLDLSLALRQGLMVAVGHPKIWRRGVKAMVEAAPSQARYDKRFAELVMHPEHELELEAGLRHTKLGKSEEIAQREEYFPSAMAEKIPGVGHIIKGSGRAYTIGGDVMRHEVFHDVLTGARKRGIEVDNEKFLRALGRYVNAATGRAGLWKLDPAAPVLNAGFFAPRLAASRIAFLNPLWYASLARDSPYVAAIAAKSMIRLVGAGALTLYGGHKLLGATAGTSPISSDFAKLKFGQTRLDIFGGFQQYLRLAAQIKEGKVTSSRTGETYSLGSGFGQRDKASLVIRFAEGKLSPPASIVDELFHGTTFEGQPLEWKREVYNRLVPLVAQDTWDLYHHTDSIPFASLGYFLSALGIGIQTYGPKPPKQRSGSSRGPRPNSLLGGGGSRGSGSSMLRGGGSSNSHSLLRSP